MIGANTFAIFRKAKWPDLGPIPVKVRPGGSRGSLKGGNFIEFDYSVAWDTQYVFRKDDGTTSQIDSTTTMLTPDYGNNDPLILNLPKRSSLLKTASANFNIEGAS